jgi:hypothetical protein
MNIKQLSVSRSLKFAAIIALIAGSTLGVTGDSQQHADE